MPLQITPHKSLTLNHATANHATAAVKWDTFNHLYAISYSTNRIYVYTVTPTSISATPGSPYTIAAPTALFVKAL
jgi:hypothetical protein